MTLSDGLVTLRPWSRDDVRFMAEASADPAIRRYNGSHDRLGHPTPPLSTTDAEGVIDQFGLNWRAFAATGTPSGVAFAILDTRSGELVGCCGVDDWSNEDVARFGYWIAPDARGRGYATRAVILLTRWLFDMGAARVFLTIVAGNEASVAVARRAGFVHEGTMRAHSVWQGKRCDVMWFAALPLEWAMRQPDEGSHNARQGVASAGDRGAF
ncbi:GNAT family N-acetyltransferase [Nonomuraea sp. K274]|uniref:GNAT family N-acetyltransferase n=1 Tax=Nonomuraea cypriaca TaxID=1187855 RepID=A0A931F3H3_9ACTN|nr:GNAT family protein [Nonomuraea cypriaca]MBF8189788.1 GNAT family N-acetyltransferase [Nonomuraea cypriaca]